MALSKLVDISHLVRAETILQHTQKDDIVFLALAIFTGIFYKFYFKDKPDPYHHVWFEKPQQTDANQRGPDTRDISLKLVESEKDAVVFWGSQSGTAEGLANQLVRDCRSRFGLNAMAADLADYDPESFASIPNSKFAIFIVSTYGEGDPSDNAASFLSWLGTNRTIRFPQLRYAAFGLGNSKYKFYNRVIDVLTQALDQLGASPLIQTGKADDANGTTHEDFTQWKDTLFLHFRKTLELEEQPDKYDPTLSIREDTSSDLIDLHLGEPVQVRAVKKGVAAPSPIQALPIKVARTLFSTKDRSCLHLELDIKEFAELKYKTGDHLAVWPSNPTSEIQRLITALGIEGRSQIPLLIKTLDLSVQVKFPSPTTWDALLGYYVEICASVPRETVMALAQFAPSDTAKDTLNRLGEDKDLYREYCSKTHVNLGRLLESVSPTPGSWSNLPLSFVLEILPTLAPRYYSISSSSIVSPKQISITVATSSEPSPATALSIPGVATGYLTDIAQKQQVEVGSVQSYNLSRYNNILENGGKLFAHIRPSKFRLPTLPKHPIIMIACGSGIAPFRGFLTERARITAIGREVGKSLLFFGSRSEDDYLYQDEIEELESSYKEIEVVTAFSRAKGRKCYVQDRVEEREEEVLELLLHQNAYFYICGSAAMARDVATRLGTFLMKRQGWGETQLREWSDSMRKTHRWQEDVWG